MKTYEQLTESQQIDAFEFARRTIQEGLTSGIFHGEDGPFTVGDVKELAQCAAENGEYDDEGKPTVTGYSVPSYFLGGCV
jgi:hypothetical protein